MSISYKELIALRRANLSQMATISPSISSRSKPSFVDVIYSQPLSSSPRKTGSGVTFAARTNTAAPTVGAAGSPLASTKTLSPSPPSAPSYLAGVPTVPISSSTTATKSPLSTVPSEFSCGGSIVPTPDGSSFLCTHHSQAISSMTTQLATDPRNFNRPRKRERETRIELAMTPKVFAAEVTVRGAVPKLEQERRRRMLFDSLDIEALLRERGVNFYKEGVSYGASIKKKRVGDVSFSEGGHGGDSQFCENMLPLEAFDDTMYEELSPEDWMVKGLLPVELVEDTEETETVAKQSQELQNNNTKRSTVGLPVTMSRMNGAGDVSSVNTAFMNHYQINKGNQRKMKDNYVQHYVPCVALYEDVNTGHARWFKAVVVDWDVKEHKLLVCFSRNVDKNDYAGEDYYGIAPSSKHYRKEKVDTITSAKGEKKCEEKDDDEHILRWLPRIYVNFVADDPTQFSERVISAHKLRAQAVDRIRYNLFIESMPIDPGQVVSDHMSQRIRSLAINTTSLLENEEHLDVVKLLKEVNDDFARVMNKQIFDQVNINSSTVAQLFSRDGGLTLESVAAIPEPRLARVYGQVQVPGQNYGAIVRAFHRNNYFGTQNEVLLTIQRVKDECGTVLKDNIFIVSPEINLCLPLMLQDFDELETRAVHQRLLQLYDNWSVNIREHIRDSLAHTSGEDEVNLKLDKKELYHDSKLKRLLTTIRFIMEDTLYYFMTASLEILTRFIEISCNHKVSIHSLSEIETGPGELIIPPREFGYDLPSDTNVHRGESVLAKEEGSLLSTFDASHPTCDEQLVREATVTESPDGMIIVTPPLFKVILKEREVVTLAPAAVPDEADKEKKQKESTCQDNLKRECKNISGKTENEKKNTEESEPEVSCTSTHVVSYTTDVEDFDRTLQAVIRKSVTMMQEIPQVESQVLEFVYNPSSYTIISIGVHHPLVEKWSDRISAAIQYATEPLLAYLDTYEQFKDIIMLDVEPYVTEIKENTTRVKDWEMLAKKWLDREDEVLRLIPLSVNIACFYVDCTDLRKRLSEKCGTLVEKFFEVMMKQARVKADQILDKSIEIRGELGKPLDTPEDISQCRDYIKLLPEQLYDLQQTINEMKEIFDSLDSFGHLLTKEDFTKMWKALSCPPKLEVEIQRKKEEISQVTVELTEKIIENQEAFMKEVEKLQKIVDIFYKKTDICKLADIIDEVHIVLGDIQALRAKASLFNVHEGLFARERTDYTHVHALSRDFEPYATLWLTVNDFTNWYKVWFFQDFSSIDAEDMTVKTTGALKNIQKCCREPKFKDKPLIIKIAEDIRNKIDEFKPILPIVRFLRTDGLKQRHWDEISKELNFEVRPGSTLNTLKDVYKMGLEHHEHQIMLISEVAARENDIEKSLQEMRKEWDAMLLETKPHKKTSCFILVKDSFDNIQELLDNQLLMTQTLSFSPFKKMYENDIEQWETNVKLVQAILDEWKVLQKAWLYLEPIFQSEDIAQQLPGENRRFHQVNKSWRFLTGRAHEVPHAMDFCTGIENCLKLFQDCNILMEKVQKGLNQYLENKRSSFARFYFLSDDELLGLLSQAKDPQKLQPDFRKLFEAVFKIDMRPPDNEMFGMFSQMDEYIPFKASVLPVRNVENWLLDVECMMKRSIREQLAKGMKTFVEVSKKEFLLRVPGQVALAINQIYWTHDCEEHFRRDNSLNNYVAPANENLMIMVETVRQKLTPLQQMNLGAMITVEVHTRDIVEKLVKENVTETNAFAWVSQLRSYWENNECVLRQIEAQFIYGCESLGNSTRLVITPLTDRIYLTLTSAMHMFLGGAPAGPAGTGKTETVKDLAKAVAKQCVVFNCQEGMTYASMGKFFKGLASSGAWACFDEFNRIDVEVLSVVAQQVGSLQEAARSGQYRIPFEGTEIVVDPTYAVFITMNPGYAGRTELPDNLKVLFRPVACMVPDYAMIAEIRLFSYGYADSRKLSQKMVVTFRLSSEQLSSQDHYDFGMRAVNTVIGAAGLMKREHPNDEEDTLLLRALNDSNAPKFLKDDLLLFSGIISDLFPGITLPQRDYGNFRVVLEEKVAENQLQPTDMFIKKCVEVFEMSVLRHGQMSVGPTMGGKSCVTRVLAQAMTKLKKDLHEDRFSEVEVYHLNPKSVTMAQLYGGFDEATAEWRDGLIGELFRIAANKPNESRQWIVFDGPVDALWIESMNTVLDDNKKLCLISGEIISMSKYMNIMFEVEDLAVASPATVSRAGMIYMEPMTCLGVGSFIKSWINYQLPPPFEPFKQNLEKICDLIFPNLIHFVQTVAVEYNPTVWCNLITSCFNIFHAFLEPFTPTKIYEVPEDKLELLRDVHQPLMVFAMVWSFGITGDQTTRKKFDRLLRDELKKNNFTILLPDFGLLHDYEFNIEERRWMSWTESAPVFNTVVTPLNYADIIVPTVDVQRYRYINKLLLLKRIHTLNIGPTGVGKSVIVSQLLFNYLPNEFTPIFFTFSARTSANQTQDLIFSKFEARRRASPQIWGAPVNKHFVIFVDDLNMPLLEQYGAQPPLELLRQYFDYKGWYDRKNREFFYIVEVVFTSAMGPPGGGRNKISNRVLRHFNHIAFPDIEDESMRTIFTALFDSYFKPFSDEVRGKLETVVTSCIEVYDTVIKELRPTPSCPHYLFNLRDLSKVVGGMMSVNVKQCSTELELTKLYVHEASRTFRDRLVDDTDRHWFDRLMELQVQKHMKFRWNEIQTGERLIYADFGKLNADTQVYQEVTDISEIGTVCDHLLEEYNNMHTKQMNLVMFTDAIEHVCRIARVLKKPGGHMLLLGVGGSGRQSLSRFAAFINDIDTSQVEISKGYSMAIWRDDLRGVIRKTSFQNKQILFLITDTQIAHEGMLEDVNSLLNSGEVPNLFVGSDVDEILNAMKPICAAEGINLDKVNMYARFVKFCKMNLHVAVAMSPMGEPFRNRIRMFPALVNCCTCDWFSAWPDQALQSVAKDYFKSIEEVEGDEALVDKCVTMCQDIHQSVEIISAKFLVETNRHIYVTPTSYLELLHCFRELVHSKAQKIKAGKSRLQNGLEKLRQTEIQVSELKVMLAESQPILLQKQQYIANMVEEMLVETATAEETKADAAAEQAAAKAKQEECAKIEADAQAILDEALPALDKALEALGRLQPQQLNEVASYRVPTSGVRLTIQALCILFNCKIVMKAVDNMAGSKKEPDYWQTAKDQLFTNMIQLLERLKNFHLNVIPTINEKLIVNVTPLVNDPQFVPEVVKNTASVACVAMCEWAHAMHKYYYTDKQVQPLRKSLAIAQVESKVSEQKLAAVQARLQEVEDKLAKLNAEKQKAEQELKDLADKVKITEVKLILAGKLIDGLADEKKNWNNTIVTLTKEEETLVGDMLVAAGQVSYVGAFSHSYRHSLVDQWTEKLIELTIPHRPKLSLFDVMQQPVQTRQWTLNSLPADTFSIENALIMTYARRWPLMIDPQLQANKWIKDTYGEQLEIVKPTNKDCIKRIEHCIRAGRPALMENLSADLDPSLDPLLLRHTFMQGGTEMIRISENAIPWNSQFKFFMTTKLSNPHYIPEAMVKVTLLNFFITPQGLEDQLLVYLVGRERKELEDQKVYFVQQNAQMKAQIEEIQSTILRKLEEVKGDVLDDEELINYLEESKRTTEEIAEKVMEAETTEKEIDATREGYRPMAFYSSILYFTCSQLSNVDPMYHYSMQWFVQLFLNGIDAAEKSDVLEERLHNLREYFTYSFYQNISRSLFEKHKLMFSFVLCVRILEGNNQLDTEAFSFLIQGASEQLTNTPPNPAPNWLTEVTWKDIWYLDVKYKVFRGFSESFAKNVKIFHEIFLSSAAHHAALPGEWNEKLTPIQKMMFIRCLRPDKLMDAVQDYVASIMGEIFIKPPQFDLSTSFKDSTPLTPLIFILSQGADPYEDWKKFAETQHMSKKLADISLGQGQGPRAERLFNEGIETGTWVLLQNCHLATSWMPALERLVEGMTSNAHPQFRLWLTSMPNPFFPVAILQNGVKMTNEPPKGMRANVTRSLLSYPDSFLENSKQVGVFKKLMFSMCFFHALIQERRKFGALGWNIPYEYTSSDLNCCVYQIKMFLDKYMNVPYMVIKELSGNIHYGGRVTDDWDRRTLMTILETFVQSAVLKDDYKFSSSGLFTSIASGSQEEYLSYVDSWPINVMPEVFGLHDNADITCARNETQETMDTIIKLQGGTLKSSGSGAGRTPDDVVTELAQSILHRVRPPFDIAAFQAKYPTRYEDSMSTVVVQEAIRFSKLLVVLRSSLLNIQMAIKGLVVMSQELESVYNSILINHVPQMWADKAYPSLKPLASWVSDLIQRLAFIETWYNKGHPHAYWISGFYFPQAFITGILQNYARAKQISVDSISHGFEWMNKKSEDIMVPPESGCYIYGMYIEGARIDSKTMTLCESFDKVLFETTPMLWLHPIINKDVCSDKVYKCPLYKTLRRAGTLSTTGHSTNYVLTLEIDSGKETWKHWVKRGVACICELND